MPVAEAQATFASAGQMLALDPPLGAGDAATIGGLVATADSGPLRHRYGGVRDLIVGITVVLSDGTVARAGGKVIKNVAGYDLAKLFTGSFGTLGYIASVSVRLHPAPAATATARALAGDPQRIAAAAAELGALPLEADCLDVAWASGRGAVLIRFGGAAAAHQARAAADRLGGAGLDDPGVVEDDDELWAGQRARQRAPEGAVAEGRGHALGPPGGAARRRGRRRHRGLARVARADLDRARPGEDLAARADAVRAALPAGASATVLDGGGALRDPWPAPPPAALVVMERIKSRFDPARVFRPGAFAGGL